MLAVYEEHRLNLRKVTGIRPEIRRSNPGQGEVAAMLWRPEGVLCASVPLILG